MSEKRTMMRLMIDTCRAAINKKIADLQINTGITRQSAAVEVMVEELAGLSAVMGIVLNQGGIAADMEMAGEEIDEEFFNEMQGAVGEGLAKC